MTNVTSRVSSLESALAALVARVAVLEAKPDYTAVINRLRYHIMDAFRWSPTALEYFTISEMSRVTVTPATSATYN